MGKQAAMSSVLFVLFVTAGCAGMKVIKPGDENKEAGTKMVDWSGGQPKIVETYSCRLESTGHRFSAIGKSEDDARKEVVAKCRDNSLISFCDPAKAKCVKN